MRGFTSFAEDRDAQALVRELNQLLSVQADVVISAGGDVDKFIGDAIMAVFLDATDTAEQVFACARQLIERTHSEITVQGWPLALGIGIHRGRAVVGSIGSATRRDFTAIGHTTNLSARLCSQAGPWEILCTDAFHTTLSAESQAEFTLTGPMQFKNVHQAVTIYSCAIRVAASSG
ncbi:MAG: adenylate/guanylate cyclase domain-containing protein [Chthoniobacteraceae bacterium]